MRISEENALTLAILANQSETRLSAPTWQKHCRPKVTGIIRKIKEIISKRSMKQGSVYYHQECQLLDNASSQITQEAWEEEAL